MGENSWPRIIWHPKTTGQRINDEGKESKGICSMKCVEGEEESARRR